jgi:hypothetical protein
MATRSVIGIIRPDNTIEAVYCHCDGYPSHNGVLLRDHYQTQEKVEALVAHGRISALEVNVPLSNGGEFENRCFKVEGNIVTPLEDDEGFEEFAYFFDSRSGDGFGQWLAAATETDSESEVVIPLADLISLEARILAASGA